MTASWQWGAAIGLPGCALLLSLVLGPIFPSAYLPLFLAACVISGWYCGRQGSLLTALLSMAGVDFFFVPPLHSFRLSFNEPPYYLTLFMSALLVSQVSAKHRTVEASLRNRNQELETLIESAPDAVILVDRAGRIVRVNARTEQLFGYQRAELIGESVEKLVPERARALHSEQRSDYSARPSVRRMETGLPLFGLRKDGSEFPADISLSPVEGSNEFRIIGTIRDITEHKRIETELRNSQQQLEERVRARTEELARSNAILQSVLDSIADSVTCANERGEVILRNAAAEKNPGKSPFDILRRDCQPTFEAFYADRTTRLVPGELPIMRAAHGESCDDLEVLMRSANGERWLSVTARPLRGSEGGLRGGVSVSRDITERKRTEQTLRRMASLFDQTYDAIAVWDWKGPITYWNRAAEELYGHLRSKAIGCNCHELLATRFPGSVEDVLRLLEQAGHWEGEVEHRTSDARWIKVESRMVLVRDTERPYVLQTNRDVTEQRSLEMQFHQAQKMEGVGQLAGGIAHDFNNLLGVIIGYTEILMDMIEEKAPRARLEDIHKAANRAAELTRQLLAFSRKQVMELRVVDLNHTLGDLSGMLKRLLGEDVEIQLRSGPGLGKVKVDPGQFHQVVMNLAVNAREAMPNGGKLTIETANADLDESYARAHVAVKPGRYVQLAISDTGEGIDSATQAHIFEPFFTTKRTGTGLGLSTVYGIVKQSGGNIWVYSERGEGTTFKIYLPRVDEPLAAPRGEATEEMARGGTETILLVEDSDGLRDVAREFLAAAGYGVLVAENGKAALELAGSHKKPIHLLLTDVVMPGISGAELAAQFKEVHPEARVLFMSGYTPNAIAHRGILDDGISLLNKPFTRRSLTEKIREVLEA